MKARQYNYKQKVDNDLQSTTQQTKKSDNMNPNKHRSWPRVLRKGKQFLLHLWHTVYHVVISIV